MEIITVLLTVLAGQSPLAIIGWLIAAGEALFIAKRLWDNNKLQEKIFEIQDLHSKAMVALQESRIDDMKDLLGQYNDSITALIKAIEKKQPVKKSGDV
jgi:hypothetical protein